jgi:hypothetical protein
VDSDGKAEFPAQLQHRGVLRQHLADQFIDAAPPRQLRQPSHQQVAEPVPFPVGTHRDGKFGSAVVEVSGKPCDPEHLFGTLGEREQRHIAVTVDVR